MSELEVKVDMQKGRLKVSRALFAGSKVTLQIKGCDFASMLALYYFDRRVFTDAPVAPRTRIFPPEGLRCVATSVMEDGVMTLNLSTQEILDIFSDGDTYPGESVFLSAYLWRENHQEVVAQGIVRLQWSPVYFKVDGTPVAMKGDKGDKGDKGEDGKDGILSPVTPGNLVAADDSGIHLKDTGLDESWLRERITAYRNASGMLILTNSRKGY